MNHPIRNLNAAVDRAIDRLVLRTIVVLPRYFRYRVRYALQAAERRRVRRRRAALAGGGAVVAVGVVALLGAKQDSDEPQGAETAQPAA